ncbi:MAG: TIGR03067 domain-containing protein [Planctomycetes bacterium]|nr:TIGR03067 domain-containing protein [Planctomycetota bacterium]
MRLPTLVAVVLIPAVLVAAPIPKDKEKAKDEVLILGIWKLDKFDNGGEPGGPPPDELDKIRFVFEKDGKLKLTGGPNGESIEGEYKLDPAAKPKTMDLTIQGRTAPGLYDLDGDTLKVCITEGENATRPTELKPDGNRTPVVTFKRVKEEKKDK